MRTDLKEQNVSAADTANNPAATANTPGVPPRSSPLTTQPQAGAPKPLGVPEPPKIVASNTAPSVNAPSTSPPPPGSAPSLVAAAPVGKPAESKPIPAPAAKPEAALAGFVHKVAGPAVQRSRHRGLMLSFVLGVILPTIVSAFYLFAIAQDQFASTVGFSVQRNDAGSAMDLLGGLTKLSGTNAPDHLILYKYIQSRDMIRAVEKEVNLAAAFVRSGDPFFSLDADATIEEREKHWRRMVKVFLDSSSGLIEIQVRAFSADTAQAIAVAIQTESARLLNELSDIAKNDATRYARDELDLTTKRLRETQEALTDFRTRNQIVDPTTDFQGRLGLLNSLLSQQAAALIELDLLDGAGAGSDPRRELAQRRINVIGQRIEAERQRISQSDGEGKEPYADLVSEYERLKLEQDFAQRAYVASLATYDAALADASRASRYLATYLPPTLAEKSEYPQRIVSTALVFGGIFILWSILVLTYYSIRDRR